MNAKKIAVIEQYQKKTLQTYIDSGYIRDNRRTEFILGENNQGIDWYLGGAMPCKKYGFVIIECPAYKKYFTPAFDNGLGMSNDITVRHMKSSPQNNPIPMELITQIFDYRQVLYDLNNNDNINEQNFLKL